MYDFLFIFRQEINDSKYFNLYFSCGNYCIKFYYIRIKCYHWKINNIKDKGRKKKKKK